MKQGDLFPPNVVLPKEREQEHVPARHLCHAEGCKRAVDPKLLMCPRHWLMVPQKLKQAVWKHYEPGQEVSKKVTRAYLDAATNAIRAVAAREGRCMPGAWGGDGCATHEGHQIGKDGRCIEGRRKR